MPYGDGDRVSSHSGGRLWLRGLVGIVLGVVVMIGCSGGGAGDSGSGEGPAGAEGSPNPSLQLSSQQVSPLPEGAETFTGMLGSDSIEGGCVYLQTADGKKYEVIPPDGWQLRKGPAELLAPDGRVVARGGDTVTIRGAVADDMMSICQIGPIIRAVEVVVGG